MSRTAPAIASILLALLLAAQTPVAQRGDPPPRTPADSLRAVVEPLFATARYDSILSLLPAFIRRAEATHDSVLLGRAITQRGRVYLARGERDHAERDIDVAIRIAESVRDTVSLMSAVNFKGFVYAGQGDYDRAMHYYERRLSLAQSAHSPADEAWARTSMAYVYQQRDDLGRARQEYVRAIELFRASGQERLELTPLIGLGRIESLTGNDREAIRCYQRAWVVARAVGDKVNEMWATNNLGVLEGEHGDLSRASSYQQRAFDLARELKSPSALVIPATNMAGRALELGDYEAADSILRETRELCRTLDADVQLATVDFRLAELRLEEGRLRAAAAAFRRLLVHPESLEPRDREFATFELARALAALDSTDAAIALVSDRLQRPDRAKYASFVPQADMELAGLFLQLNDAAHALEYASSARRAAQSANLSRLTIRAMLRESVCLRLLGQEEIAAETFDAALDSLEVFRGGISTPEWREVYGQAVARDVVEAGRVLLTYPDSLPQSSRDEAFFDAMQRVKTRTLLDRITEPRFGHGEIEARWSRRVATRADLQAVLLPGEAVLDFYVGTHRSFLAAVTADSVRLVELPGPDSPLAERVDLFRNIVASSNASLREQYPVARMQGMQRALGHDVLGGVADVVARSTRVFIAPDGFFASIPFGALIVGDGEEMLMAGRDVIQVPSASVLVLRRSLGQAECVRDPSLIAIGSGEAHLAGARDEVRDLTRRYGHAEAVVNVAGVESFRDATGQCDVLHVAAHALVVDRSPWESGIRLDATTAIDPPTGDAAPRRDEAGILPAADSMLVERTFQSDPYVRAWQIAQLSLPAKLAVLSACETAGGRVTSGEGTLGITAAFLSAGVPVVVSSLWAIDDRATSEIMRAFYHHLSQRKPVATALREAQLELSRSRKYAHPFYWAGFTVVGDGSMVIEIEARRGRWNPVVLAALGAVLLVATAAVIQRRRVRASVG